MTDRYEKWRYTQCAARFPGRYPNAYIKVFPDGFIDFTYYPREDGGGIGFAFDRRTARLIARRIMQALEETKR